MIPDAVGGAPHRRYDPLRDEWVLVSAGRTNRPWLGKRESVPAAAKPTYDASCYLCPRNTRVNGAQNPDYADTFVFTNDFAALRPDTPLGEWTDGLLRAEGQRGTSRVLCFSPRHDLTITSMPPSAVRGVVDVWAAQTSELGERYRWVQLFENRGAEMGASNPHPHGQIWAGSALPGSPAREDSTQRRHRDTTGRLLLLDIAAQEADGPRVVDRTDGWLAIVPFWAVWPFETLLLPRRPVARLPELDDVARDDLAAILQRLMARYDLLFDRPFPFSFGWHLAHFEAGATEHWQLHAHFYPPLLEAEKRKFMVGYELLAEAQRDITAEDAAERLRSAVPAAVADGGGS